MYIFRPISLSFSSSYHSTTILHHEPNYNIPSTSTRNILITSALPYVNNTPHLGNIIGAVLSGDAYARYCRLRGYNTLYVCGTDEYGTTSQVKALKEGVSAKQICDKYHSLHSEIYRWFNISFDIFGRTSKQVHCQQVQQIFALLHANNLMQKKKTQQFFCSHCKISLADRYVKGTCSKCGSKNAKGDQCDDCSTLFKDPITEVIDPLCSVCLKTPQIKNTDHLYFKLTTLSEELNSWVKEKNTMEDWSNNAKGFTKSWLKGLQDRCITRDVKWGVPVPSHLLPDKVFYVWFEAPIGYISLTRQLLGEDWEKWWKPEKDFQVELNQFMGKDNIVFHSVITPAALMGTKQRYVLPKRLAVSEYLMYEGGKFSKSRGIGIFGGDCKETQIESEVWRYYLFTNRPEVYDSEFTWEGLVQRNNKDLVNSIGNSFNRILKFVHKKYKNKSLHLEKQNLTQLEHSLFSELHTIFQSYLQLMEKTEIKNATQKVLQYSHVLNKYLQDSEFWNKEKMQTGRTEVVMAVSLRCLHLYSIILYPLLPLTSLRMSEMVGKKITFSNCIGNQSMSFADRVLAEKWQDYGLDVEPYLLFKTISAEKENELREKYGSNKRSG